MAQCRCSIGAGASHPGKATDVQHNRDGDDVQCSADGIGKGGIVSIAIVLDLGCWLCVLMGGTRFGEMLVGGFSVVSLLAMLVLMPAV